jgi:hypothetical protein
VVLLQFLDLIRLLKYQSARSAPFTIV